MVRLGSQDWQGTHQQTAQIGGKGQGWMEEGKGGRGGENVKGKVEMERRKRRGGEKSQRPRKDNEIGQM